jgi:hypothetical protein
MTTTTASGSRLIPIYTTRGDLGAYLGYPYIFSRQGEWIGWVTRERQVYSVHGDYVGWLSNDPRILRKLADSAGLEHRSPPPAPKRINLPASAPLAPLMSELSFGTLDVLQDDPDLLPPIDAGERRQDMD